MPRAKIYGDPSHNAVIGGGSDLSRAQGGKQRLVELAARQRLAEAPQGRGVGCRLIEADAEKAPEAQPIGERRLGGRVGQAVQGLQQQRPRQQPDREGRPTHRRRVDLNQHPFQRRPIEQGGDPIQGRIDANLRPDQALDEVALPSLRRIPSPRSTTESAVGERLLGDVTSPGPRRSGIDSGSSLRLGLFGTGSSYPYLLFFSAGRRRRRILQPWQWLLPSRHSSRSWPPTSSAPRPSRSPASAALVIRAGRLSASPRSGDNGVGRTSSTN